MTPAIDLAHRKNIKFTVHQYQHDPGVDSYGDEAAISLNINASKVFKTLIVETNTGELVVGLVPVSSTLNLKAIASTCKAKKAAMADKLKVQRSTGYVIGGVSPIGQRKALETVIDISAKEFDTIYVSAGKRGLEIELSPNDLASLSNARFSAISNR